MARIAVVGAGPAGIYSANLLLADESVERVDVFEALPAPYGLVRYGVAPDHPRIKSVVSTLSDMLETPRMRLFCGVHFGQHLSLEDIKQRYNAVIFATGALRGARLDIPGIDARNSFSAADFVAWYDGHPDYPRTWPLSAKSVGIIGNGNVALDIARILVKQPEELETTEIPDNVYEDLKSSALSDVHIFGRRGPFDVKFTPLELRELGEVNGVDIVLNEDDFQVKPDRLVKQMIIIDRVFSSWRARSGTSSTRRLHFHFYSVPKRVVVRDNCVSGLEYQQLRPTIDACDFVAPPRDSDTRHEVVELDALYTAIGYYGSPLSDLPFDDISGIIPNDRGRVIIEGKPLRGCYVTGWIKRGPVGLIGHTKSDAIETIGSMRQDKTAWWKPDTDSDISDLLGSRGVNFTGVSGWRKLDAHEIYLGSLSGKTRKKVVPREEMQYISSRGGPS